MKKLIFFPAFVCLLASCSSTKKTTGSSSTAQTSASSTTSISGKHDGSSFEKAVIIQEKSETTGVKAEYAWLKEYYPGYKTQSQVLKNYNGKPYDIISILTEDGSKKDVYFDISNFYGKF